MEMTLGKRIAHLRRLKNMKQDDLAQQLNISPQAISKWENDQSCPDISALPLLSKIFDVSIDELLTGQRYEIKGVKALSAENKKQLCDMMLKIVIDDSAEGDIVKVNLPMEIIKVMVEMGMKMDGMLGKDIPPIDIKKIFTMVEMGMIGNLVEIDQNDGTKIRIYVE